MKFCSAYNGAINNLIIARKKKKFPIYFPIKSYFSYKKYNFFENITF